MSQRSYFTALSLAHELTKDWKLSHSARVQLEGTVADLFFNLMPVEDFKGLLDQQLVASDMRDTSYDRVRMEQ